MTITEIIEKLEEIQKGTTPTGFERYSDTSPQDINQVCRMSKHLALHVQQLELEMRKMKGEV